LPTTTTKIGLKKFAGSDDFHILDWDDNFDLIDAFAGIYICDSSSRPTTWGSDQTGLAIYEVDTKLHWVWNGSAFERMFPKGWLGGAVRTTPFSTTATVPTMVTQVPITIPDQFPPNTRRYAIVVQGPSVDNDMGEAGLAVYRDTTQLQAWNEPVNHAIPGPLRMTVVDRNASAGSTYTYSIQANAVIPAGGTTALGAASDNPIQINVVEV
jgi:hypothetical protein